MPVVLKLVSHQGEIQVIGEEILVKEQSLSEHVVFVYLNKTGNKRFISNKRNINRYIISN